MKIYMDNAVHAYLEKHGTSTLTISTRLGAG